MVSIRHCLLPAALGLLLSAGLLIGPPPAHAQDRSNTVPRVSPNATVSQTVGVTTVEIAYGRPSVRGRDIFGGLVPFNKFWRTGANEATTFSVSTPVRIEGQSLDAGTYGLFTIPGPDTWTLIFNETADQWGAYNYDAGEDALRVEVEPEPARAREQMTFEFHDVTDSTATAVLHWAETRVPFDIAANTLAILQDRGNETAASADSWQAPLRYVGYALENEVLLDSALDWVNRSIEIEEHYTNLRMKAHVLAATGAYEQAVSTGTAAVEKGEAADETPDSLGELKEKIESWKSNM